ncbi:hypothetical protein C8R44DRAFT_370066 [Mycena epipterygia]|nr:hypothetical protein C8R44DRAFT_370066 [Mycena epipterygia]
MSLLAVATLPEDLERRIFELAAFVHPESMPTLIQIAQRVRPWIEPLLYQVLTICSDRPTSRKNTVFRFTVAALYNLIDLGRKPVSFFHDHVRHVRFIGTHTPEDIIRILSKCSATVNVSFLVIAEEGLTLLPLLAELPLQCASFVLLALFGPDWMDFRPFAHITHLNIIGYIDLDGIGWERWLGLALLPGLTHISFHEEVMMDNCFYQNVLEHCRSLEVHAIVYSNRVALEMGAPRRAELSSDPRFVMFVIEDLEVDWETGARGGRDHWVKADKFVGQRLSGERKSELSYHSGRRVATNIFCRFSSDFGLAAMLSLIKFSTVSSPLKGSRRVFRY